MDVKTRIFTQLQDHILKGSLTPGEKLTEQRICEEYQVSRTPVREAFRLLELYGLIETVPNRGAFVRGLSAQNISDLHELRTSYEILAVRWAIERMTPQELAELAEAYELMEFYTMKGDGERMLAINMNFHGLIYKGSHNPMLANLLSVCQLYTRQTAGGASYTKRYLQQVLAEHQEIYQAFLDRNPDAGVAAVSAHLTNSRRRREEPTSCV